MEGRMEEWKGRIKEGRNKGRENGRNEEWKEEIKEGRKD